MIAQFIFLYALQMLGILFGISFKKNLHITFISLSGLLWGQLFWVIAAMLLMIFGVPFLLPNILIILGVFTGLLI